ncbi:WD40-repeat-containing domain protein [Syncephalis fuscata]|nr:WD40-repeat-containing domain protein [Syncephalis fuscata]
MTINDSSKLPLQLHVKLHEARSLDARDEDTGASDPYVVCRLGKRHHRSRIIKRSLDPRWNEAFRLPGDDIEGQELDIQVYDYDYGLPDDFLGNLSIDLSSLKIDEEKDEWYPLNGGSGDIRISLKLTHESPEKLKGEAYAAGVNFSAVRPWAGAIFPPSTFDPTSVKAEPAAELQLSHAYGYRARNCRNNVRLITSTNNVIYHTASLGIVHSMARNSQTIYQGHESAEILSLATDPSNKYVATGDQATVYNNNNKQVFIKVWEVEKPGETVASLTCVPNMAGVVSMAFSAGEGKYIAAVGSDSTHMVSIFDWRKGGEPLCSVPGHSDKVLELVFHPTDPHTFITVGVKHIKFWTYDPVANTLDARKGIFGKLGEIQPLLSATFVDDKTVVTGCHNGDIYTWSLDSHKVISVAEKAHEGSVFATAARAGVGILTGGKDGRLVLHVAGAKPRVAYHDTSSNTAIRAISWDGNQVAIGYDDSSIMVLRGMDAILANEGNAEARRLVEAHSTVNNAEVWGLAMHPEAPECITVSEDMRVIRWDLENRHPMISLQLDRPLRTCAYHPSGNQVAIGATSDHVFIVEANQLIPQRELHEEGGRSTDVEHPLKYSPDGKYLAVGGVKDDNGVGVYDTSNWKLVGVCSGHSSHVIHLDWSADSKYLQTNSMEHELLFWSIPSCEQITKSSDMSDTDWESFELTMAWPTVGIWEPGMHGRDINAVSRNADRNLLISGNDFSQVGLHTYPCYQEKMPSQKYRGHASHVTAVGFTADNQWAVSVGGLDGTLLQWKIVPKA